MIKKELQRRRSILTQALTSMNTFLQNAPEGSLRVDRRKGGPRFYLVSNQKKGNGIYIRKENSKLIADLAMKDYYRVAQKMAASELKCIDHYLAHSIYEKIGCVYDGLIDCRKSLVDPILLSDEEFVRRWEAEEFETKGVSANEAKYFTKKNEVVRSKSEILIANTLCDLGIPYRYEAALEIPGFGKIYPDFTILNVRTKEIRYLEHCGKMDDLEYVQILLSRLSQYAKAGIILGKNLFLTFESLSFPLNIKDTIKQLRFIGGLEG